MIQHPSTFRPIASALLVLAVLCMAGCSGWSVGQQKVIDVKAKYLGLKDQRVAVVVSASDHIDFNYPNARGTIANEVTRRIAENVPGVSVSSPRQILEWQDKTPYWGTRPPSTLIRQLDVDRLVLVEIGEYRMHEPGDKHVLRGVISASVNIVEADAVDPDNFSASFTKNVMYPEPGESKIGRIAVEEDKVEMLTQYRFSEETAGLFYDHKIVR